MADNNIIQTLASQAENAYKGDVCFYVDVKKRKFKEGKDAGLAMYQTSYASFNIFNSATKKGVSYFLDATEPLYLMEQTKLCMKCRFDGKLRGSVDTPKSPAYTMKITMGEFKGMTPAQVLANPQNVEKLTQHYHMLIKNINDPQLHKFQKNNQEQLGAIVEAFQLYQQQQLRATPVYPVVELLNGVKTPNNKKLNEKGLTEVRLIAITFNTDPTCKEPYYVEITNCMAPPTNGMVGAKLSQAQDRVTLSMSLSEEAWFDILTETIAAKDAYVHASENEKIAYCEKMSWKPNQNQIQQPQNQAQQMQQMPQYYQGYYGGQPYYPTA